MNKYPDLIAWYSNINELEAHLLAAYAAMDEASGMNKSEAHESAHKMLQKAKAASLTEGTFNLPVNQGDISLEREKTDQRVAAAMVKRRREGVRDDDIRWWWNRHDLERRMMMEDHNIHVLATYIEFRTQTADLQDCRRRTLQLHAAYGDPTETCPGNEQDRLLPFELADRIARYIERRLHEGSADAMRAELQSCSSFNAFVRMEITQGRL